MTRASWILAVPFLLALALRAPLALLDVDDVRWPQGLVDDRIGGEYRTVSVPDEPWVLVTGGSSVFWGFDLDRMGPARKQSFERGYPSDVALALSWALGRTLPRERWPSRVVWGVTMASFVDRKGGTQHPCTTQVARSRPDPRILDPYDADGLCAGLDLQDRLGLWVGRVDPWSRRRSATRDLAASRLRWRTPDPEPDDFSGHVGHDEAALRRNLAAWERFGVFGPSAVATVHADAANEVGRLCREAGIPLTVVSLPEPAVVRERYDPAGRAAFDALLRAQSADVLDLWAALPDTAFYDQVHVDADGRALLTAALEAHLGR